MADLDRVIARKMKRRVKTQAWRDRAGKWKPMKGQMFWNGHLIGNVKGVGLSLVTT